MATDYLLPNGLLTGCKWTGSNGAEIVAMCNANNFNGCTWSLVSETAGVELKIKQTLIDTTVVGPISIYPTAPNVTVCNYQQGLFYILNDTDYSTMLIKLGSLGSIPGVSDSISAGVARSFTNNASRSIVTGTGATGFQVSSTKDAVVGYNIALSSTATIGGSSTATCVLEIAATNSATASDWKEIARVSNGQTITLAVALQSVQTTNGQLSGMVPKGYYAKLRSITTGTASATYNVGQEVLL